VSPSVPAWPDSANLWIIGLFVATAAVGQPAVEKMVVWAPGMDHDYQNGVLWLKAEAPGAAALAVDLR